MKIFTSISANSNGFSKYEKTSNNRINFLNPSMTPSKEIPKTISPIFMAGHKLSLIYKHQMSHSFIRPQLHFFLYILFWKTDYKAIFTAGQDLVCRPGCTEDGGGKGGFLGQ
jgi:hypothetical protein